MYTDIELADLARERREGAYALAAALRDARIARGPQRLATSGPRASAARWMSRALLRAEPCQGEAAAS